MEHGTTLPLGLEGVAALKEALDAIAESKAGKNPDRRPAYEEDVIQLLDDADVAEPWRSVWIDLAQAEDSVSVAGAIEDDTVQARLAGIRRLNEVFQVLGVDVTMTCRTRDSRSADVAHSRGLRQ